MGEDFLKILVNAIRLKECCDLSESLSILKLWWGKPCIRGMRVTVGMLVEAMSAGRTIQNLLDDFPYLEEQDIFEALGFAAQLALPD